MPKLKVSGSGVALVSAGAIMCSCGVKTIVPAKAVGSVRCSGCGQVSRVRR